jgi:uncharacterized protein (DUF2252 family)
VEVDPGFAMAWANRGILRTARGRVAEAIADFDRALELAPPGWPSRRMVESLREEARRGGP